MTATCTFNGTTVPTAQIQKIDQVGNNSGTIYKFECSLFCRTPTYSVYSALAALRGHVSKDLLESGKYAIQSKGGTKASLVLNGTTYTNCYIEDISAAEASKSNLGMWEFTISFVKDTSIS